MTHRRRRRRHSADAKSSNGRRHAGEWMREGHALRANFTILHVCTTHPRIYAHQNGNDFPPQRRAAAARIFSHNNIVLAVKLFLVPPHTRTLFLVYTYMLYDD